MPGKTNAPEFDDHGRNTRGPTVEVVLRLPEGMRKKQKPPLPDAPLIALIDTGAVVSCVKQSIADKHLLWTGETVNLTTAETEKPCPTAVAQSKTYWAEVEIGSGKVKCIRMAALPDNTAYDAVLGMDALKHCRLEYEGPNKHLMLRVL